MRKQYQMVLPALGIMASLGAASVAQAEMVTYACQFDPAEPAGLTINYDTVTSQFSLVNYYGSSALPAGVQVSAFKASGNVLEFALAVYNGANMERTDKYRFDFPARQATLDRQTSSAAAVQLSGNCTANGQPMTQAQPAAVAPSAPASPASPPSQVTAEVALPHFYGNLYQAEVLAAVQLSELAPVTGTPDAGITPPQNTVCGGVQASGQDPYIDATWCATTKLDSADFSYGSILGFVSPDSQYGREMAWCTSMGGHGNFGQGESIEIKYWMPRIPPAIKALAIRSGTGNPSDSAYLHSKPRVLRVEAPGMAWTWNLQSNTDFQAITFAEPFQSDWIRVVIEDAYMGDTWSNTCMTDMFAVFETQ